MTTETEGPVLLDVNVLLALALDSHVHHRAAHRALAGLTSWATCSITEAGLIRLLLNPTVTAHSFGFGEIRSVLVGMRADPRWCFLVDDTSLIDPAVDAGVLAGHRQVADLMLVNLAVRHGAVLATFDGGVPGMLSPADQRHVRVLPVW